MSKGPCTHGHVPAFKNSKAHLNSLRLPSTTCLCTKTAPKRVLFELSQVSSTASLRNTRFFLYAIPQWSSDLITCLLSEQSNEVIITQRESINPTQESRRINAPIQAPVIGHRERECERWREREGEKEPCRRVEQGSTLTAPTIRGRSSNLISHSGNNREDDQHAGSCFV